MIAAMTVEEIKQNLMDAGCDDQLIQSYLSAMQERDHHKCTRILEGWRRALLDEIHGTEEQLSCLDYLRYQLQKRKGENGR